MNTFKRINFIVMLSTALYLIYHYFQVRYPDSLLAGLSCNINSYFNCSAASFADISNVAGVPIALLGAIMASFFLYSTFKPSRTYHTLVKLNTIGSLCLLVYSVTVLKSICPICALYYLNSFLALIGTEKTWRLELKPMGIILITAFISAGLLSIYSTNLEQTVTEKYPKLIEEYNALPLLTQNESSYILHKSTENFKDAPIRITVFSDFECPYCYDLAQELPKIIERYPGKINAQYFFYPLDIKCNRDVTEPIHDYACDLAYRAACQEKFLEVHDYIFNNEINASFINTLDTKYPCRDLSLAREKVLSNMEEAHRLKIDSTPSLMLNGKMINVIDTQAFYLLIDYLLKEGK